MKLIFLYFTISFINLGIAKQLDTPFKIYNSAGRQVSFSKVIKHLEDKHFIFFGEYHNNAIAHWLQLELSQALYTENTNKLVLGGEMFEADNQYILDEYLNGIISAKNYQSEMRLWPNYNTDYKPLVEFAKENELKFIATNIPRRYANVVYKKGVDELQNISADAKKFITPLKSFTFDSTVICYKNMLSMGHGGLNMAKAQAIKDATMAYFIQKNSTPQTIFLHFNGSYHSDNHEGIIYYLKKTVEANKIATITTVSQDNINALESQHLNKADFIICVKSNFTNTH